MKTSTEIGSVSKIVGEEKAVEYVARAGFDAWDFSMFEMCKYNWRTNLVTVTSKDYLKLARKLKNIGLENGIVCNQSHAPFPTSNLDVRSYLKRAIECTAEAGGKICVIHPCNNSTPKENAEFYFELLPFAKECGVKIATENMWNWNNEKDEACAAACSSHENFKKHIDVVNDDFFVACVDIGHGEMKGLNTSAADIIRHLGSKVQALHIHDNDKWHDSHQLPFTMNIDFEPILKALKDIGYSGYFTLEADAYLSSEGYTAKNVLDGVKNMSVTADKLCSLYENL